MDIFGAIEKGDLAAVMAQAAAGGLGKRGPNRTTPLIAAAEQGRAEIVRALIDAGADLNHQDADTQTALTTAIYSMQEGVAVMLLDAGANAALENWRALDFAVRFGSADLVGRLLSLGADANRGDEGDPTPLLEAAARGDREMLGLLLEAGADPKAALADGSNALTFAIHHGRYELIDELIGAGCPLGTCLHAAASRGDAALAERLLAMGADPNAAERSFGFTPLSSAASRGDAAMIGILLAGGAAPDQADRNGQTPMDAAIMGGHGAAVRKLLDGGSDPNRKRGRNGNTPLTWAVAMGQAAIAKVLMERGADVNAPGEGGVAPLAWAVGQGAAKSAALLLQAGAEPNTEIASRERHGHFADCPKGTTVLMLAARGGKLPVVEALLAAGADPHRRNEQGESAADFAVRAGKKAVAARLAELGAASAADTPAFHAAALHGAVATCDVQSVRAALKKGADPNAPRKDDEATPLMVAALEGQVEIVAALLGAGADPNGRTQWDETALRNAVVRGHEAAVRTLLASGADPEQRYGEGSVRSAERNTVIISLESPMCDAAFCGHLAILEALLAAGADVNGRTASGYTPLLAAVLGRRYDAAARLEDAGAVRLPEHGDFLAVLDWAAEAANTRFEACAAAIAASCGVKPAPVSWLPGVLSYAVASEDGAAPAQDRIAALLDDPGAAGAGFMPIDGGAPLGCGPAVRTLLLFPTADPFAVMAAFGVRANDAEMSTRDIIAWFRALAKEAPFRLRECRFDTVGVEFERPLDDPERWAQAFCTFCSDMFDPDEADLLAERMRTERRFTFWWD